MLRTDLCHCRINSTIACFPQENKHFEDAFQAYEKGVSLFKYPHSKDIWSAYLTKFVARYGGKKLERARDLFRHALREVRLLLTMCPSINQKCCYAKVLNDVCPTGKTALHEEEGSPKARTEGAA